MNESLKGVLAMIAACAIWGLSSLYYKLLEQVPPLEVLSHRTLWSALFFGIVLAFQGRLGQVPALLGGRRVLLVTLAALCISANWFMFILSIQIGHAMQASLGYYIFPLVAVVLGIVAFGERPNAAQAVAVTLALLAVVVLTWGLGVTPWISLTIAVTFGFYGLLKKRLDAGPVVSVTAEVLVLSPIALVWLAGLQIGAWPGQPPAHFTLSDPRTAALLALSGILTGGPLVLFSYAARRVNMATVGLIQYVNPTLQFLIATFIFAEPFTPWHLAAFALIWAALVIYSVATVARDRAVRRASTRLSTSGISPT
ncbi:EamA family transporter RarD [Acidimangrovimonas sediminis]|uniref:EamA family transporter RarD n=1 Tax=Acidimangrovimonas sediminis TaxID=2056283 RepID=UPI000C80A9E7|nr:EamA family transporter RarD [Acidimangrovimonas sediminis]